MKSNSTKILSIAAIAFSILGNPSQAAADQSDRMSAAWSGLLAGAEPVLTPLQTAKINNLAFQSAATRICEGFELDEKKFVAALADATKPTNDKLSEESLLARQNYILIDFGMRVGVLLAEGAAVPKSFCEGASELKAQSDLPHVWE